ncbi:hypothetical protein CHS0354_042669 [Potamilus streckersoni]|uniref:Uncharacterized protein n=1 Tax=Potamilus streckersoni TaxID=2493646 RepID=A0AAE0WC05_9BIVA|nr:hypothetical protein CHS0354_042669 [Potamilus streckersoni]
MNSRSGSLSSRSQSGDSLMSYDEGENSLAHSFDSLETESMKSENDAENKPKNDAHNGKIELKKLTGKARNVTDRLYRPPPLKFKYTGKQKQENIPIPKTVRTRGKNTSSRKSSVSSVAELPLSPVAPEEPPHQENNEENYSLDEETQTTEDLNDSSNGVRHVTSAADFVSLLYSPQSVIVELMEAKLSYTMGHTETLIQSIQEQLHEAEKNCDKARDERQETYRIVSEYMKNLKENLENSKDYLQTCRIIVNDLRDMATKTENKEKRESFILRRKAAIEAFRLERQQVEKEFTSEKSRISFNGIDIARDVDSANLETPYTIGGQSPKRIMKHFVSVRKQMVQKERGYSFDQPTRLQSKQCNTTIPNSGNLRLKLDAQVLRYKQNLPIANLTSPKWRRFSFEDI